MDVKKCLISAGVATTYLGIFVGGYKLDEFMMNNLDELQISYAREFTADCVKTASAVGAAIGVGTLLTKILYYKKSN